VHENVQNISVNFCKKDMYIKGKMSQKIFLLGGRGFLVSDVISGGLLGHLSLVATSLLALC